MTAITIEVSPGVYSELEGLARPFEDRNPEDVIVRLLRECKEKMQRSTSTDTPNTEDGGGLATGGTVLPNGLKMRFSLYGKRYETELRSGRIQVGTRAYDSPSSAAAAAAAYLGYENRSLNGWYYWEFQDEQGTWKRLRNLQKTRHGRGKRRRRMS
jgi:hypothetical protein